MAGSAAGESALQDVLSAVGAALSSRAGGSREERVRAVEQAIQEKIAGLAPERAGEILGRIEERYPVRQTPAEAECGKLQEELLAEKARSASLEAKVRELEEKVRRGAAEEVRHCIEVIIGKALAAPEDPKKLTVIVGALVESVNKTIGYANVGLDRWEFKDARFPPLEEMAAEHIGKSPEALAEGLRQSLSRMRELIKAMIKADLQFTPKWCDSVQARFARESFEAGGAKAARAWEKYAEFIETYSFRAELMQGLRTFIDGERQRPA